MIVYKLLLIAALTPALLFSTACHRKNVQRLSVHVPMMNSEAGASLIKSAFITPDGAIEGVQQVETDLAAKTVYVTYDSRKIAIKNIEYTICHLGFEANSNKPDAAAQSRLPAECR